MTMAGLLAGTAQIGRRSLAHVADSDMFHSWRASASVISATLTVVAFFVVALLAPWIALQNIYDPATNDIMMALAPPAWMQGGEWMMPLGGDNQGRDVLSAIFYGLRLSLAVGFGSIALAMAIGICASSADTPAGRWMSC
jgi:peptide/nickel transport system permease protein